MNSSHVHADVATARAAESILHWAKLFTPTYAMIYEFQLPSGIGMLMTLGIM